MVGKPCMARIDVSQLLRPFEEGINGVEIHKCDYEDCRFKGCEEWIEKHVKRAKKILKEIGIKEDRLKIVCYRDK